MVQRSRSTAMQDVEKVGRDDASLQSKYFLLLSNEKSFQKPKTNRKQTEECESLKSGRYSSSF